MNGITNEDKDIVLDYILIHLLIDMLERDKLAVTQSKLKIQEPYQKLLDRSLQISFQERKSIHEKMRKRGIKVMERNDINEDFVEYPYLVRGYESSLRMFRYALRNYLRDKLNSLFLGIDDESFISKYRN